MVNYSLKDYAKDVVDSLIDLEFPYIVVFLGTMQLGVFEEMQVQKQIVDLMMAINAINVKSLVLFCGLVP